MADGSYRHFGAGIDPQQNQSFYYQQNQPVQQQRQLARNRTPPNSGTSGYSNDAPLPPRSPTSASTSHSSFPMYGHAHQQGQQGMVLGGSAHQRYMQMNLHLKHHNPPPQQHHGQQNHHQQQVHGSHSVQSSLSPQHSFATGILPNINQGFTSNLSATTKDADVDPSEPITEHWQHQLDLVGETRQSVLLQHRHSKRPGAVVPSKSSQQPALDHLQEANEAAERKKALTRPGESRRDWDGLDISGQGLRSLTIRLFQDYAFLTKLFIDNNKINYLPQDIGRLRHLIVLQASNNQLQELPTSIGMLSGPPPRERPRVLLDDSEAAETFTVLDYNILCDRYATTAKYQYLCTKALDWGYRRDLILNTIKAQNADIVCLQEVDLQSYEEFFRGELAYQHYKGVYFQKSRARTMAEREAKLVDGCAIFYNGQKFILLDKQLIDFANTAINRLDMKGEHDVFNRVMLRDDIAVVCLFENRITGSRMIVANTHIFWNPIYEDVKLVQVAILMEQVAKFADRWATFPACIDKVAFRHSAQDSDLDIDLPPPVAVEPGQSLEYSTGSQIPLLVCGDFNTSRGSGIYELLTTGSILPNHPDLGHRNYGNFTRDGMHHPFNLKSAYAKEGTGTDYIDITNYTPDFSGLIDYIWHSSTLTPRELLGNIDPEYLARVPGFPTFHYPSDHIALFVEFAVLPRRERPKPVEADFGAQRERRD